MSANSCTQVQLDAAMDAIWADLEARYNTIEDVKARLAFELWGVPMPAPVPAAPAVTPVAAEPVSESESTESKRGRKKGAMTEEAKAKMVAKRAATIATKKAAAQPEAAPEAPSPVVEAAPLRIKAPKVKMSKDERSAAAKARYAAMTEEAKAAIRERLVKARMAAKEAKA